ncbi:MAG: hypothetical protein AAGK09_07220 [Planctomycetota bacterium]
MMKKTPCFVLFSTATLLSAAVGCSTGESAAVSEENAQLRREVAQLRAELEAERRSQPADAVAVAAPAEDPDALAARIEQAEQEIEDLKAERDQLELLAGVSSKGDAIASAQALITERYDSKADRTWVVAKPRPIRPQGLLSPADHVLGTAFSYPGPPSKTPTNASDIQLVLYTLGNPTAQYEGFRRVTLKFEGESIDLPVDRYRLINETRKVKPARQSNAAPPQVSRDERLDIDIDDETVRRISRASELWMVLPNGLRFDLGREAIAQIAAMQARRNPVN